MEMNWLFDIINSYKLELEEKATERYEQGLTTENERVLEADVNNQIIDKFSQLENTIKTFIKDTNNL